jgi:hypothetical protein
VPRMVKLPWIPSEADWLRLNRPGESGEFLM